ncbi:heterokaryon incompatibility protein-domain-containing protein [Paraphoma chrysanthemicola]|nr:heterokaryon incompatibility protein-domain-containing protein [Paraphoma chrysanthemicola]
MAVMSSGKALMQTSLSHSAPPTSTSDTISLHDLCDECTNLCRSWEVLDWLQHPVEIPNPTSPRVKHCTVAHLQANQHACHFCSFLLGSLIRSKRVTVGREDQLKIFLHLHEDKDAFHKGYTVRAELAEQEPTEDGTRALFDAFLLKTYEHTESGAFDQHIIAKTVPRIAHNNLERARHWIETCKSNHTTCRQFHHDTVGQDRQRPTRILEISSDAVKLRDSMSDKDFEYLVLSHMWGTPSPTSAHDSILQLNLANVHEFCTLQQDIPWDKLSPIYHEAIRATVALGYKYLWIDSLCIIQDSSADWEYEARGMASVYGNAACNLAFLFPDEQIADGKGYTRDDPRVWNPCILRPATRSQLGICIQHSTSHLRATYHSIEDQDWLVTRYWPLFGRAWTFQEYLLAPRTLLLGHRNLMWQCSDGFYDELLGPVAVAPIQYDDTNPKRGSDMGKTRYFPESLGAFARREVGLSSVASLSFVGDWQALMNEYRSRRLTKAKDRIVAFAGIARAFTNLGASTYLAGCWERFLPLSLLWYVDRKLEATVRREVEGQKVVRGGKVSFPIAVREQVEQYAPFVLNNDEVYVRGRSLQSDGRVRWDDIHWLDSHSFQFLKHTTDEFPESGFFDFTGLTLTLGMPVLPVHVSWPTQIGKHFQHIRAANTHDAGLDWIPEFEYYPDNPVQAGNAPPRHGVLALLAEFQIVRIAGKYKVQRRFAGLVLVPVKGLRGVWARTGAWKLLVKICGVDVSEESINAVAERWRRHDVRGEGWLLEKITLV